MFMQRSFLNWAPVKVIEAADIIEATEVVEAAEIIEATQVNMPCFSPLGSTLVNDVF